MGVECGRDLKTEARLTIPLGINRGEATLESVKLHRLFERASGAAIISFLEHMSIDLSQILGNF
jgi:hypothetical protein